MTTTAVAAPVAATDSSRRATMPFGHRFAAVALVIGAAGNTLEPVLGQFVGNRPDAAADQIQLYADHPVLITALLLVGTLAVPFMALGFVAAARLLHRKARRTAWAAGSLLVIGMWGFLGTHTLDLIGRAALAQKEAPAAGFLSNEVYDDTLLNVVFGQPFFVGAALGMLVLTIGMLMTGAVPRWIPACWLGFILLDFSIGSVGPVDPHWLYLAGAVGLAVHILRGRGVAWWKD
ncbi:hypothetical protein [Ornithinimicrobium cryptoxanthini]|uniref:DUF4386 family protein n=1 Tax=Ornithinimicrobium cryptoxanthini TaxID=2934161 RepID=A0ABY4YL33_9MICO|nr:hypothetical protein [Ornithinimicrobium cryptoxanthini]USQ77271.1 hypothetical protein NF557_04975 [Ornithinimicrobium cryptoxanthini]